jgi:hypothetical protein
VKIATGSSATASWSINSGGSGGGQLQVTANGLQAPSAGTSANAYNVAEYVPSGSTPAYSYPTFFVANSSGYYSLAGTLVPSD